MTYDTKEARLDKILLSGLKLYKSILKLCKIKALQIVVNTHVYLYNLYSVTQLPNFILVLQC